jgi:hypothetical protein
VLGYRSLPTSYSSNCKAVGGYHRYSASYFYIRACSAQNGNLELPIWFLKAKQGYTVRKVDILYMCCLWPHGLSNLNRLLQALRILIIVYSCVLQQRSTLIGSIVQDVIFSIPHFAKALLRNIYQYTFLQNRSPGMKFGNKKEVPLWCTNIYRVHFEHCTHEYFVPLKVAVWCVVVNYERYSVICFCILKCSLMMKCCQKVSQFYVARKRKFCAPDSVLDKKVHK